MPQKNSQGGSRRTIEMAESMTAIIDPASLNLYNQLPIRGVAKQKDAKLRHGHWPDHSQFLLRGGRDTGKSDGPVLGINQVPQHSLRKGLVYMLPHHTRER
jgi:hypothetical protein